MNIKRIIGSGLTLLGIGGLIYAAILLMNSSDSTHSSSEIIIFSVLGFLFFFAGIGLIQATNDN